MKTDEELLQLIEEKISDVAADVLYEYGYWDGDIEEEKLTHEDVLRIFKLNPQINISVEI